jgi:hypothetical protein
MLERDNEAFILYDGKTKTGGRSRNTEFFTIEGNKIREVEVYFGSAPKETGVNNDYGFWFRLLPHISARCHSTGLQDDQF